MQPLPASASWHGAVRALGAGEGDRAAGLGLTIQIVALQWRRHEKPRDRIHAGEVGAVAGAGPVRLLATG
jgi:hypothetical protein